MQKPTLLILVGLLVTACTSPEEARRQSLVGTENGQPIYEYTVEHWPTALWSKTKLEAWVKRDGLKRCPDGYREISRTRGQSHVDYSGPISMPYNDVIVRVTCPAQAAVAGK